MSTATAELPAPTLLNEADENGPALPEGATGFRERKRKAPPRASTTVPGLTVGGVRRALNRESHFFRGSSSVPFTHSFSFCHLPPKTEIRRAGNSIRPEHLLVSFDEAAYSFACRRKSP